MREVKGWVVTVFFARRVNCGKFCDKYFSDTSTNYCTAQQREKVNCHTGHFKRVSMGLTDRRKTAKNLVDSPKN